MAEHKKHPHQTEDRSSQTPPEGAADRTRRDTSVDDRSSAGQTGGPRLMRREMEKLDAATDEEVDALRVNLTQDRPNPGSRDSSGLVVDELAEEKMAKFTEVGPYSGDRGAESVTPGRDNTSATLRKHHPNTSVARAEDVVEGNLDEPSNEETMERKVDEGTAA